MGDTLLDRSEYDPLRLLRAEVVEPTARAHPSVIYPPRKLGPDDFLFFNQHTVVLPPYSSTRLFVGCDVMLPPGPRRTCLAAEFDSCVVDGLADPMCCMYNVPCYDLCVPHVINSGREPRVFREGEPFARVRVCTRDVTVDRPRLGPVLCPEFEAELREILQSRAWKHIPTCAPVCAEFSAPWHNEPAACAYYASFDAAAAAAENPCAGDAAER